MEEVMKASLRILHLEDDLLDAELTRASLEAEGLVCEVIQVDNREDFLAAVKKGGFDLILSDYALPTFDGMSALATAREICPDVPFILLSGTLGEELAIETLKSGATDYVLKQRLTRLGPAVKRALREAEERIERRQAEEALRKQQQFMNAMFESMHAAIIACDSDGIITLFNRAAREFHGIPEEPTPSEHWVDRYDLYEADGKTPMKLDNVPLFRALQGEVVRDVEINIVPKLGKARTMLTSGQSVTSASGEKLGAVVAAHDISERKQLEEQLRQAQKMEAVGRLAGGIAHDFNNLLTAIMGYSELILRRLSDGDPMRQDAEEINKAGQRASSLTRQLLAFSRKQVLQPRVLDLNSVVSELQKMLTRSIGEDIELVAKLAPGLGCVQADPGHIEQVIVNLVVNARDAMPSGGVLTIQTANIDTGDERPSVIPSRQYVLLSVSDTGCGISDDVQSRIFEPFFTTKDAGKGTGLGLATVYGIVEQWGGRILVDSELGKGATFRILLPRLAQATEPMRGQQRRAQVPSRGSETILLVEDDEAIRKLAREVLEMSGYEILESRNADEALVFCEKYKGEIHLMLTDIVMPGLSGRALVHCIEPLRPGMKVLYMSGYSGEPLGMLDPDTPFIAKPFSAMGLGIKVREVLDMPQAPAESQTELTTAPVK